MTSAKICMLGTLAVGKTSLVERFVHRIYGERYLTTIGVRVDTKELSLDGRKLKLAIWDIHGEDDLQQVQRWQLRGSAGYLLVADGTRKGTVAAAALIHERARAQLGELPFEFLVNKRDLAAAWEVGPAELEPLRVAGWSIRESSALSGENVEQAFEALARAIVDG